MKNVESKSNEIESAEREFAFAQLLNSFETERDNSNGYIEYNLPYPKELFLKYLTEKKSFLLHGSSQNLDILEPQQANDTHKKSGNKKAVYAVTDPVLPIFYSIKDKAKINGRVVSGKSDNDGVIKYEFAMPRQSLEQYPYKDGVVYILDRNDFTPESDEGTPSDEWTSSQSVTPWAKLKVKPEDFQYLNEVQAID